jgi:hypothetical protein
MRDIETDADRVMQKGHFDEFIFISWQLSFKLFEIQAVAVNDNVNSFELAQNFVDKLLTVTHLLMLVMSILMCFM